MSRLVDLIRDDTNIDYLWEQAANAADEGRWSELQAAYNEAINQRDISERMFEAGHPDAFPYQAAIFQEQADEIGGFLGIEASWAHGPDPEAEAERRYFDLADPAYVADLRRSSLDDWAFDDYDL